MPVYQEPNDRVCGFHRCDRGCGLVLTENFRPLGGANSTEATGAEQSRTR